MIVTLILLSFSCRKEEAEEGSGSASLETTAVTTTLSSETEGVAKTPLTFASPESAGREENTDFDLDFLYRGGEILIKAEFTPSSGVLNFNIEEDEIETIITGFLVRHPEMEKISHTLSESTLTLCYDSVTEEKIEERWKDFKDYLNEYNSSKSSLSSAVSPDELVIIKEGDTVKGLLTASVYSNRAEITVPDTFTEDETAAFLEYIRDEYPEVLDYGTVAVNGRVLTLEYSPSFTNEDASALFFALVSLVDEYFAPEAPFPETDEISSEEPIVLPLSDTTEESISGNDENEVKTVKEAPLTEAGNSVRKFTLSAIVENSWDSLSGYDFTSYVKLDYAIRESFSVGFVTGYDSSLFVPVGVSVRYYTRFLPSLYLEGTFGGRIGVGSNMNYGEWFSIVSLGYEYSLNGRWSLFAAADFAFRTGRKAKGVRWGLSFGGRVTL